MTFFFYGDNVYALRQQLAKMSAEYLKRTGSDFGLQRIDGAAAKPQELAAVLQAAPFLATSRLVIVENAAANKSAKVGALMATVPDTTVAVFVESQVDRRTTAYKDLGAADRVIEFKPLPPGQLVSWVVAEVKRLGGSIGRPAAQALVDLVGDDQWRLAEEANKLVNFSSDITVDAVKDLVIASVDQSIFDLVDAMTAGRVSVALAGYRTMLDRRESEIYILTMVQWQLRNLLWAVTAPNGITQAELAKAAGLSPFVAGKAIAARKHSTEAILVAAYILASEAEFDIKTGRIKAEAAVEQLIYNVAASVEAKHAS